MSFLTRFSISFRLYAILVVSLGGVIMFGTLYILSNANTQTMVKRQSVALAMLDSAHGVAQGMLELKVFENEFLATRSMAVTDAYVNVSETMTQRVSELQELVETNKADFGEDIAQMETILELTNRVGQALNDQVLLFEEMRAAVETMGVTSDVGLRGALSESAQNIEDKLAQLERKAIGETLNTINSLLAKMLRTRAEERQMIITADAETFLPEVEKNAKRFTRELRFAQFFDEDKKALQNGIESYMKNVLAYGEGLSNQGQAKIASEQAFEALQPQIQTLFEAISTLEQKAKTAADKSQADFEMTIAAMAGTLVVALVVLIPLIGVSISRPVNHLTAAMRGISKGDLSVIVPATDQKDEVGTMARSLQVFKTAAIEQARLEAEQREIEERAMQERSQALKVLATTIEQDTKDVVNKLSESAQVMNDQAQTMGDSSHRVNHVADEVATLAKDSQENAKVVALSASELSESVNSVLQQVAEQRTIARAASQEASQTTETVDGLNRAAAQIGQVVDLIREIAEQTNLLALNATIEAARAGDAGKGFAVVASEVKNLASQVARATEDIGAQVGDMQSITATCVRAISNIAATIERLNGISETVAEAVQDQGMATQDIAMNIEETTKASEQVTERISNVSTETAQNGDLAQELRHRADDLQTDMASLRHTLARIVYTASDETDRRSQDRVTLDLPMHVIINGQRQEGTLNDVSDGGGAFTLEDVSEFAEGDMIELQFGANGNTYEVQVAHAKESLLTVMAHENIGELLTSYAVDTPEGDLVITKKMYQAEKLSA